MAKLARPTLEEIQKRLQRTDDEYCKFLEKVLSGKDITARPPETDTDLKATFGYLQKTRPRFSETQKIRRNLSGILIGQIVQHEPAFKKTYSKLRKTSATTTIKVGDEELSMAQLRERISQEHDPNTRKNYLEAQIELATKLRGDYEENYKATKKVLGNLGYGGWRDVFKRHYGISHEKETRVSKHFLELTEKLYKRELSKQASELELDPHKLISADIFYILNMGDFLKKKGVNQVDVVKVALDSLNAFRVRQNKRITIDADEREHKNPRPVNISTSEGSIIVLDPRNRTLQTVQSALHELGHGVHKSHLSQRRVPFAFKEAAYSANTEAWATLFEGLFMNKHFLKKHLGFNEQLAGEVSRRATLSRLIAMRFASATTLAHKVIDRHGPSEETAKNAYEITARALGAKTLPGQHNLYLMGMGLDPEGGANYSTAFRFSTALMDKLERKYGDSWFEKREAVRYIKGLMHDGVGRALPQLAKISGIDMSPRKVARIFERKMSLKRNMEGHGIAKGVTPKKTHKTKPIKPRYS